MKPPTNMIIIIKAYSGMVVARTSPYPTVVRVIILKYNAMTYWCFGFRMFHLYQGFPSTSLPSKAPIQELWGKSSLFDTWKCPTKPQTQAIQWQKSTASSTNPTNCTTPYDTDMSALYLLTNLEERIILSNFASRNNRNNRKAWALPTAGKASVNAPYGMEDTKSIQNDPYR